RSLLPPTRRLDRPHRPLSAGPFPSPLPLPLQERRNVQVPIILVRVQAHAARTLGLRWLRFRATARRWPAEEFVVIVGVVDERLQRGRRRSRRFRRGARISGWFGVGAVHGA